MASQDVRQRGVLSRFHHQTAALCYCQYLETLKRKRETPPCDNKDFFKLSSWFSPNFAGFSLRLAQHVGRGRAQVSSAPIVTIFPDRKPFDTRNFEGEPGVPPKISGRKAAPRVAHCIAVSFKSFININFADRDLTGGEPVDQERRIRREIANSNERRRMQSINAGFQSLRTLLPHHEGEKLSKVRKLGPNRRDTLML